MMEHTNILFPFNEKIKVNKLIFLLVILLLILILKLLPLTLQNFEYIYIIPEVFPDKVILTSILPVEQTEKILKIEQVVCDDTNFAIDNMKITPFIDEATGQGYNNIELEIANNDCFKTSVMQKVKVLKEKQSIKERIKRILN